MPKDMELPKRLMSPYKIPDNLIDIRDNEIEIQLVDKGQTENPGILKLISDLKSGRLKNQRILSHSIKNDYVNNNEIVIFMTNEYKNSESTKSLFHWTKKENVEKILKEGLKPSGPTLYVSSFGSLTYTYNGVFLSEFPEKLNKIQGFTFYKRPKFELLEIRKPSMKLWTDSNIIRQIDYRSVDPKSYIVFESIEPKYIKLKQPKINNEWK